MWFRKHISFINELIELVNCRLHALYISSALISLPSVHTLSSIVVSSFIDLYILNANLPFIISECAPSLDRLFDSYSFIILMPLTMLDSQARLSLPEAALLICLRQSDRYLGSGSSNPYRICSKAWMFDWKSPLSWFS